MTGPRQALWLAVTCAVVHVIAGSAMLALVIPALHDGLVASGAATQALPLEAALRRFAVLVTALPPVPATVTGLGVWGVLGPSRTKESVARWMALGCVPLALDSVWRSWRAWHSPQTRMAGEALAWMLQVPGSLANLGAGDWSVWIQDISLCSAAAVLCFGAALANAGNSTRGPVRGAALLAVGAAYLSALSAAQALFPIASQRLLMVVG